MKKPAPCYGATREEWTHFDLILGLTEDLLPVVSNPNAKISPNSRMRDMGKTPSLYDRAGGVVGIREWTSKRPTHFDMERWQKNPDYGICLQTRTVRAIDIDVTDPNMVAEILRIIKQHLPHIDFPERSRPNSAKTLIAFTVHGHMPKRVIKVKEKVVDAATGKMVEPAQLIEFLASGQQFVVIGTHKSQARYGWPKGLPTEFPEISLDEFEDLWIALEERFACEPSSIGSVRNNGESFTAADDICDKIREKGLELGTGNDGQLFIECPWKDGHSSDSGVTETAYFPRGSKGYKLGHFKCMHASCQGRKDEDLEEALGLHEDMFEEVEPVKTAEGEIVKALPAWARDGKGRVESTLYNLRVSLERPDIIGREIKYDYYSDDELTRSLLEPDWRPLRDADLVAIRERLETKYGFKQIGRELMRDAVMAHGVLNSFDFAADWLMNLEDWDGRDRITDFMHEYYNCENTPFAKSLGHYWWTAHAGRIIEPGIKADMAVILSGLQGENKSTAISCMVPFDSWFTEISLGDKEDTLARRMRGKSSIELGELGGMHAKELEEMKAFIVRRKDEWVPKYRERTTAFLRRNVFVGTTNRTDFLVDETGNRRFLPIVVGRADVKKIVRDRNQLWAQARDWFLADGIMWQEAEKLAKLEHVNFAAHDSWEDDISIWLNDDEMTKVKPADKPYLKTSEIFKEALGISSQGTNPGLEKRLSRVMKSLQWEKKVTWVDGRAARVFVRVG